MSRRAAPREAEEEADIGMMCCAGRGQDGWLDFIHAITAENYTKYVGNLERDQPRV